MQRGRIRPQASETRTLSWYARNAELYADRTRDVDVRAARDRFLRQVRPGGRILDAGCGSGRDAAAFLAAGFRVDAYDASAALVERASAGLGIAVPVLRHQEFERPNTYDGIFAFATLLHLSRAELPDVFARFHRALRQGGVLACSLKVGERDGPDADGRWHTYFTPGSFREFAARETPFRDLDLRIAPDALRPGLVWIDAHLR
jgi:SAM-dependent methyltransferase